MTLKQQQGRAMELVCDDCGVTAYMVHIGEGVYYAKPNYGFVRRSDSTGKHDRCRRCEWAHAKSLKP